MSGRNFSISLLILAGAILLPGAGCRRQSREPVLGEAFVASNSANVRDPLGVSQVTVATVKAGEKVQIVRKRRHWLRVRTASGTEGWLEDRHVVTRETFDQFRKLRQETASKIPQGQAHARRDLNLHLEPDRQSPHYFQLKEGESCDVMERRAAERTPPRGLAPGPESPEKLEDWYLVRASDKVGWCPARSLDMSVPDDILQHSEGKRVTAWFVLNWVTLKDGPPGEEKKPQVLWATTGQDGAPYDFDSFRVFVWSFRRRRYETAYIERKVRGYYPIQVSHQGESPTFSVITEDKQGEKVTRKFVLRENLVKRE